jgi:hypothetical protein
VFKLDEEFVDNLGLSGLSPAAKNHFSHSFYSEIEIRVGERLTEGMSDEQLDEFEIFVDKQIPLVDEWLDEHFSLDDLSNRRYMFEEYKIAVSKSKAPLEIDDFKSDFGATLWLKLNRPNYPEIVAETMEEMRQEILHDPSKVLRFYAEKEAS